MKSINGEVRICLSSLQIKRKRQSEDVRTDFSPQIPFGTVVNAKHDMIASHIIGVL